MRPDPLRQGRPRRLALFTGNYNYTRDGASQAVHRLVRRLERNGDWTVRIYSPVTATPAFDRSREVVAVPSAPTPLRPEYRIALGLPPRIARDVRAFAPDIFHLATPDLLGAGAQRLARKLGTPMVSSVHTRFETYCDYYGLRWLKPLVAQRIAAFYAGSDYVLAPTRPIAEAMAAEGLGDRVRIWSRGVDRAQFDPARRDMEWRRANGFADEDLVAVFFGRLVMEKGLAVFAEAVRQAQRSQPRVRTLVIGEGPARTWLAQRLPGAVFTGLLTGDALGRAVASGDVLVNPSITEAFGNVTLEAMAAGLAPVCADVPSHRALLGRGAGLLCASGDPAAFAAAIVDMADQPLRRLRLARAGREASAAFDWDAAIESVLDVYAEALGHGDEAAAAARSHAVG